MRLETLRALWHAVTMISTHGTYRDGAVLLEGPVSLPEGTPVHVLLESDTISVAAESVDVCCDGSPWDDSPEGARAWITWFDALEPMMTEQEFQRWDAVRMAEKERQKALTVRESERIAAIFP